MKYIPLSEKTVISTDSIIGIFDLDTTTVSKITREFLSRSEKQGNVVSEAGILPRSFTVYCKKGVTSVYLSPVNSSTLKKRI